MTDDVYKMMVVVPDEDLADWVSVLSGSEVFSLSLDDDGQMQIADYNPNPDYSKQHPAYSLDYSMVSNIVIQGLGTVAALIAISDKLLEIIRSREGKSDSSTVDSEEDRVIVHFEEKKMTITELKQYIEQHYVKKPK